MKKIKQINKQTQNKYVNLYDIVYDDDKLNEEYHYQFASRKDYDNLHIRKPNEIKPDAVRILPWFKATSQLYLVLVKEFRYPINGYVVSLPAGLVDSGENPIESARRELLEETGCVAKSLRKISSASFISPGLSDESVECYEAEVEISSKPNLQSHESMSSIVLPFKKIDRFLKTENIDLQSKFLIENFYYKTLVNDLKKQKEKEI